MKLRPFFASGPNFLDPQLSNDGTPYGPKRYKEIVKETALYHHCRVNNGGYPQEIAKPILSNLIQILAISDCFEAMTAKRVYKEKINPIIAKEMILDGKCGEFSKKILEIFENAFEEISTITRADIEKKTVL